MKEHRFNVFGYLIAVRRTEGGGWTTYLLGADGKRRPAGIVVPSFIDEADLGQYLADILHESATPSNNKVVKLD